jgi:parallel beta-helix repeat protein
MGPNVTIDSNLLTKNRLAGVRIASSHGITIANNTITYNSTRYISVTKHGGGTTRDLQISNSTRVVNKNNKLTPVK